MQGYGGDSYENSSSMMSLRPQEGGKGGKKSVVSGVKVDVGDVDERGEGGKKISSMMEDVGLSVVSGVKVDVGDIDEGGETRSSTSEYVRVFCLSEVIVAVRDVDEGAEGGKERRSGPKQRLSRSRLAPSSASLMLSWRHQDPITNM